MVLRSFALGGTALAAVVAACSSYSADEPSAGPPVNVPSDAGASDAPLPITDAPVEAAPPTGACDPTAPFESNALVPGLETLLAGYATLTADELTLYATVFEASGSTGIVRSIRATTAAPFGPPAPVAAANTNAVEYEPSVTADGRKLYFIRIVGGANRDIYRADPASDAGATPVLALSTSGDELGPSAGPIDEWMYFTRGSTIFYAERLPGSGELATPAPVSSLGTPAEHPAVSADQRTIYFSSTRSGPASDIYVATRPSANVPFDTPRPVPELNSPDSDHPDWLSSDNCRLYYTVQVGTTSGRLHVASRSARR